MKIFYIQQAAIIDWYLSKYESDCISGSYESVLDKLTFFGFASLFGIDHKSMFLCIANSRVLQFKWAKQNNLKFKKSSWKTDIIAAQIEAFRPDVIYTGDHYFFTKDLKDFLPSVSLYALWNASMIKDKSLTHFDLGLSFNSFYLEQLARLGIKNLEYNSFYVNPLIKNHIESMNLPVDIDIVFAGRYAPMFKNRNKLLCDVHEAFNRSHKVQYHLLTAKRFKGLIPSVPWKLLNAYKKPVFLESMFKVFSRSKIVLNMHSDITGAYKGNMRVFESLGIGAFLLTDAGNYPKYLIDGQHFVSYWKGRFNL